MLRFLLVAAALGCAVFVYAKWIRPTIRNLPHIKEALDNADTFWQKLFVWVRVQWDVIVSGALIILPELPDLIQQLTSLDLSAVIPSNTAKSVTTILGIVSLVAKVVILKKTS